MKNIASLDTAQSTPPKRTTPQRFPIEFRKRSCVVKIYRTPNKGTDHFTLSYYLGAKRKRQKFSDLDKAKEEAQNALNKLLAGETEALKLTGADRAAYVHAAQTLSSKLPGSNLLQVVEEFTTARQLLPDHLDLLDVCRDWLKRNDCPTKTPQDVFKELLEAKSKAGLSSVYLDDLKRLSRFCSEFERNLLSITSADVQAFLNNLGLAPQTRNNYRKLLKTLFQFADHRGYLPKDHSVMDGVAKAKLPDTEVQIFTVLEMKRLLLTVRHELVPYFAIGAFAGLRTAELKRLDWSEVNMEERFIEVAAKKAKTGSRRLVPITDNLYAWLKPHAVDSGAVAKFVANMGRQTDKLVSDVNQKWSDMEFVWKHNAMRHSFVSFRLAAVKDAAQVALEAGNSPHMIFRHYRQLVTEKEAERWFSIYP